MERYHPSLVTLHWLMAVLIVVALLSGGFVPLDFHLASGMLIAGLFLFRIISRLATRAVQPHAEQTGIQARIARWMHFALYGLIAAVVASGLGMAIDANLFQVVQSNAQLPAGFAESPMHAAHALLTKLLLVAVAGHALAALWHQFIQRDHLLSRMWFSKRRERMAGK
ncbi:cytochrome b [Ruegeria arenilitoris]|uniref:cytochrome b n=1 Tax=Ruegeria arenilitoris TaxID=1173585 RepID=UPI00147AF4E9|nr:cytochrome b/b6 domain-containing protein [Ruegeria arenilitoris]